MKIQYYNVLSDHLDISISYGKTHEVTTVIFIVVTLKPR